MIPASRIYTFIDETKSYAVYFLEGQKLIADLVTMQMIRMELMGFFRELTFGAVLLNSFLKKGEALGVYLDLDDKNCHFKLETGFDHLTRCLLMPDEMKIDKNDIKGLLRIVKHGPYQKEPYKSIIGIENEPISGVIDKMLLSSYQFHARLHSANSSDAAYLFTALPGIDKDIDDDQREKNFLAKESHFRADIMKIIETGNTDIDFFKDAFDEIGLKYLASRSIDVGCTCSRERMLTAICSIKPEELEVEFAVNDPLEVTCDYCKSSFPISSRDVEEFIGKMN